MSNFVYNSHFYLEREVRTPYSEAYTIQERDQDQQRTVGRVDIHFTDDLVHVTLAADERLTQDSIQEIIDQIDRSLLDAVGITSAGFVVHVFQGQETGVFTNEERYGQNGSEG